MRPTFLNTCSDSRNSTFAHIKPQGNITAEAEEEESHKYQPHVGPDATCLFSCSNLNSDREAGQVTPSGHEQQKGWPFLKSK
jgi:hypothetical protein